MGGRLGPGRRSGWCTCGSCVAWDDNGGRVRSTGCGLEWLTRTHSCTGLPGCHPDNGDGARDPSIPDTRRHAFREQNGSSSHRTADPLMTLCHRDTPTSPCRRQRGHAVAIEATIIIPVLVLFVALVIVLARDSLTQQAVGAAASQAARAASLERSTGAAQDAAASAAASSLHDAGILCTGQQVLVNTAALVAPLGTPASISVTVTCVVEFDVTIPGFPQQRRLSETRTSPVDTYRGR